MNTKKNGWWDRLVFKVGDQARRVLRNLPYPVKRKILQADPVQIDNRSDRRMLVINVPEKILDILWTSWSWMRYLRGECGLTVVIDGNIEAETRRLIQDILPGADLRTIAECRKDLEGICSGLSEYLYSNRFYAHSAATFWHQMHYDTLDVDSDILLFDRPDEIIEEGFRNGRMLYLANEDQPYHDPWMIEKSNSLGVPINLEMCAGLFYVRRGMVSREILQKIFDGWSVEADHWCASQTLYGIIAGIHRAIPLSRQRHVNNTTGKFPWERDIDYQNLVLRHFFGQVRHLMYLKGIPHLLNIAGKSFYAKR